MWINFQRVNPTLKLSWHPKNVFFENLVWGFILKTRKMGFQSLFQKCQKNNQLKDRNNRLLHAVLSKQPVEICHYCMKMGHTIRFCRVRMFFVPKCILNWVPKVSKVPKTPINIIGPKFIRGPNLAS